MTKIRVIVEVTGGCAYVYADRPDKLDVVVVDHDTEGVPADELHILAGDFGKERVTLDFGGVERGPEFEALWESIQNAENCPNEDEEE